MGLDLSITELFSVPVFSFECPSAAPMNEELKRFIYEMKDRSKPENRSVSGGGWQSRKNLFDSPNESIEPLRSFVSDCYDSMLREYYGLANLDRDRLRTEAWANVNPAGGHHKSHIHLGGFHWSGVYYIATKCRSQDDGCIVFEDKIFWNGDKGKVENHWRVPVPRRSPAKSVREMRLTPRDGLLVMFPASLFHRVTEFLGEDERVTIAFNIADPELTVAAESDKASLSTVGKVENWIKHNFWGIYAPYKLLRRRITGSTTRLQR